MDDMEIKKFMFEQLNNNVSLSDIQQMINEKFKTKMSYMDIRIMASSLDGIDWSKNDPVEEKPAEDTEEGDNAKAAPPAGDGQTVVEISKLVRPGAAVSGSVKFASGASATWVLDQMGRLGFDDTVGEPTEEDTKLFIEELKRVLQGQR